MAKRQPHPDPITERFISAVFDENGVQYRQFKEAAEFLGVPYNTFVSRLRRAKVSTSMAVDYDAFIPFPISRDHRTDKEYVTLRSMAELDAGMKLTSNKREEPVTAFRAKSEHFICCYDDEYGFYWRKRAEGERGWLVRE